MQYKINKWGPYSKKYMGISKIVESEKATGTRFDFTVHPTVCNSAVPVPNVTTPSNYHLWHCNSDYSFYSYRYELVWKDRLYADVSFVKMGENTHLVRTEFVNNTELTQNVLLNTFASLEYKSVKYAHVETPEKCVLKKANDYDGFSYAKERPWDAQMTDGLFKGMFMDNDFYMGCGLGDRCNNSHVSFMNLKPFGCEAGDKVSYSFNLGGAEFQNPVISLRYKTVTEGDAEFSMNGKAVTLKNSPKLTFAVLPFFESFTLESLGGAGVEFDFFAVTENCEKEKVSVKEKTRPYVPNISTENAGAGKRVRLKYEGVSEPFYILTHNAKTRQRAVNSGALEDAVITRLSNGDVTFDDVRETFTSSFSRKKSDDGYFANTLIKSIFIKPNERHTEYVVLSNEKTQPLSDAEYESIYTTAFSSYIGENSRNGAFRYNNRGKKYELSTEILKSTLLTNVVYPMFNHGENVVSFAPGKRWDSFYTWDSGFIGMGLLEVDCALCEHVLSSYLTDEGNRDFAFLLHGSLVPTQFAEYLELLNRTNDKESLNYLYPKMKRYYEFLRGREGTSTCGKFGNGLLTTYDYWYSHCGMDDYPAQMAMIERKEEAKTCPCLSTAQIIMCGKILKMVATYLEKNEDVKEYDADINVSTKALNELTWDDEAGYYSYTQYDGEGNVTNFLRTENGENLNKGIDGIYPLVAGAVDENKKERVLSHIKSPNELWSRAGISAVDMSASYFKNDGYWNGNVWMAHQWYIWKTMLDLGEVQFAFQIADRALNMWKSETDFSYNTYECFGIETKRGGWFHQFGGLSAPILIWADAYYKPKTVTTGFDVWVNSQKVNNNLAEISFKYYGNAKNYAIIVTLTDEFEYTASLNDSPIEFNERQNGCLEFLIDGSVKEGKLCVWAK